MSEAFLHPADALDHCVTHRGGEQALSFPQSGGGATYEQWADEAYALARGLLALGLGPDRHIALMAENRREWPVVQLAVALAGSIFVPLNTHYRRDDLETVLRHSRADALITVPAFRSNPYLDHIRDMRGLLRDLDHVIVIGDARGGDARGGDAGREELSYEALVDSGRARPGMVLPERDGTQDGAMLFTSGTTGTPKGAMLTHRGMMLNAHQTALRLGIGPGDRWTSIIPLFHCAGCIMSLLGGLQHGACYVGVPAFEPVSMFETIEAERCTVLSGVPTSFLAMLEHPLRAEFDLTSLRTGTCGGADCNADVLKACARDYPIPQICQVYGQTEACTLIAAPDASDPLRFETAGPPLADHEVRIIEPATGAEQPPGAIGEIRARGPMVMTCYFGAPDATEETLDDDGWLHTGDLGYLTETGHLVISGGRLGDMIIRGGENIYPAEIENLLQEHPAVSSVAVFGVTDVYYGERVTATVVLSGETSAGELQAFCADRIARFNIPTEVFVAQAFPLTPSGKIRKVELREQVARGELERLA